MKVLILGASGIIGTHMRLSIPAGVEAIFHRRTKSPGYIAADLSEGRTVMQLLKFHRADVVVNLAGESNTDAVEANPLGYEHINSIVPAMLARNSKRLVHISTQAVFGGDSPGYGPESRCNYVNAYGRQKFEADCSVLYYSNTTIIRPTFVLGIRPDPSIGRQNPIEAMLSGQRKQVSDRYFSVSFAPDVAHCIWQAAVNPDPRRIIHAGIPHRTSRYQIACDLGLDVDPVSHSDFPGLAPRPVDTTYAEGDYRMGYAEGLAACRVAWEARETVTA